MILHNVEKWEGNTVMSQNKVTIKIPRELYVLIKELIGDSGFDSATDFITYCLRDIVYGSKSTSNTAPEAPQAVKAVYTKEEIEKLKDRLRGLGYL